MLEPIKNLTWDAVENTAYEAFNVAGLEEETDWLRKAWAILEEAGITSYSRESERQEKSIYFLSLVGIYLDFCSVAFDEICMDIDINYCYSLCAESLGINMAAFSKDKLIEFLEVITKTLAELEQDEIFGLEDFEQCKKDFFEESLREIVDEAREIILPKLFNGLGGKSAFFLSIYRGTKEAMGYNDYDNEDDEEYEEDEQEDDDEILNNLTNAKAFNWVVNEECDPYI
jgi:hypothetical protein